MYDKSFLLLITKTVHKKRGIIDKMVLITVKLLLNTQFGQLFRYKTGQS